MLTLSVRWVECRRMTYHNQPKNISAYLNDTNMFLSYIYESIKGSVFFILPNLVTFVHISDRSTIYPYTNYLRRNVNEIFRFQVQTQDEIMKILTSLRTKDSSGFDGISTKLLKFLAPSLISPLTLIINQSLVTGIFPTKLKIAKVAPLHKKGHSYLMTNYRPVSLLSAISKLFEKVVYNQLYTHFQTYKLFYFSQYGFRKRHSTEFAALELIDKVLQNIDDKNATFAIYMDLLKAFDTLNHRILINKLSHYGIHGNELAWFSSYLCDRIQYVEI